MGRRTMKPFDPAAADRRRQAQIQARALAEAHTRAQAQAAARRPETWGVAAEPLALAANADVDARRDARGRIAGAHRVDVFEALNARGGLGAPELAAARRLERDIGLRAGLFGPGASYVLVDAQGSSEGLTQRMIEAGRRVEAALTGLGARQARLLRALIEPAMLAGRAVAWREVVAHEADEANPHAQAALVRAACADLALAYQALDRTRPGRRESAGTPVG